MMKLVMTKAMNSHLMKIGVTLLLAPLGAACGSSDNGGATDGGGSTDSSTATDSGSASDSAYAQDSRDHPDGAYAPEGGNGPDGGNAPDSGQTADGGNAPALAVNLGTSGNYAILAKAGISTVPTSAVTGNVGVSPAAASYITGFSLTADSTNVFATSPQVTGKVYASDYAPPTPSNLTTAIGDMQLAFTDAAGRAASVTELGAGNIGGMTLSAGVYKWGTGLLIPTSVTLTGGATDVWIFQIAQDLTMSSATSIVLTGGAMPKNVFWQVAGLVDLGTTAHFEGVILTQTSVALHTGASITGRLLAQTAVSIDGSAVVEPAM